MTNRTVRDVMSPSTATVEPMTTVTRAAALMRELDATDVLVAYERDLFGVLTARDIVLRAVAGGHDPDRTRVGSVCPPPAVVALAPHDTTDRAAELMRRYSVRRLPVVEPDGAPVGVVGAADLLGEAAA
ncbi:CBS domain-containing protein [Streptomyces sp. CRN 30]|uniref:CBS domain-containing protein n=1 Tax=Streptomyces sp. CRN 30 TaxID=3075613 RepID=UPI002A813FA2|nr:CBS domain-containing protein [Streptomyces sp. CRN 30]